MNGNGIWKTIAVGLAGMLTGLLSFMFVESKNHITLAEGRDVFADKGTTVAQLANQDNTMKGFAEDQKETLKELRDLTGEVREEKASVELLTRTLNDGGRRAASR